MKKKSPAEKMLHFTVRMTPAQHREVKKAARKLKMSLSEYLRGSVAERKLGGRCPVCMSDIRQAVYFGGGVVD